MLCYHLFGSFVWIVPWETCWLIIDCSMGNMLAYYLCGLCLVGYSLKLRYTKWDNSLMCSNSIILVFVYLLPHLFIYLAVITWGSSPWKTDISLRLHSMSRPCHLTLRSDERFSDLNEEVRSRCLVGWHLVGGTQVVIHG